MESKNCFCWSESIKISLTIGGISALLTYFIFEILIKINCTTEFLAYIFTGATIISLIASRIGLVINKGNKLN